LACVEIFFFENPGWLLDLADNGESAWSCYNALADFA
jgi:hypothetical protein